MSVKLKPSGRRGPGQPTKLDPAKLRPLLAAGAADTKIAQALGIDRRTVLNWRRRHPELFADRMVLPVPRRLIDGGANTRRSAQRCRLAGRRRNEAMMKTGLA